MTDDELIDKCARLCDAMILELEAQKPGARKGQYDRQSPLRIDFAIRSVRRVGERIRALKGVQEPDAPKSDSGKLAKAIALAKELRPTIAKTAGSAWRQEMLQRIDEITGQ